MDESIKRSLRNFVNCVILDRHECVGYFKNKFAPTKETFILDFDPIIKYYVCKHCGKNSDNARPWGWFRRWLNRLACRKFNFHLLVRETTVHDVISPLENRPAWEEGFEVMEYYKCSICNHEEGHKMVKVWPKPKIQQ